MSMQPVRQDLVRDQHGAWYRSSEAILAWVFAAITLGYLLPWAIAATRGKANSAAILLINLLLGWTVIGWIVALIMACTAHQTGVVTSFAPQPQQYAAAVAPAGWYPQADGSQRWWNGAAWAEPTPALPAASAAAGWYPDSERAGGQRWWDGSQWTDHRA